MKRFIPVAVAVLILAGCGTLATIRQQPMIVAGCNEWRSVEANPTVQLALSAAQTAANLAGYGAPTAALHWVRLSGDRFCAEGPPAGDVTTETDRASWLAKLTADLLAGAMK